MAKMWKGRFKSATHPLMEAFGQSISFDQELGRQDVAGSLAHAKMLASVGLLSRKDWQAIKKGLEAIGKDIAEGNMRYDPANEDIHMSIEAELTKRIGEPAKKLHTGRSRNDQVATDLRLWVREKQDALRERLRALMLSLLDVAARERQTVIPGYTHLQRAQPVLLAHHILAYVEMFGRDRERLLDCR
ncbi:MAG: argininosuccinate lyase, partial [Planctomycetota bacterium]|nr:argininosuccinate lyase [Planctomycetota bacterium]